MATAFGGGGSYDPYPWDEHEYHRVALQMVQVCPAGSKGSSAAATVQG